MFETFFGILWGSTLRGNSSNKPIPLDIDIPENNSCGLYCLLSALDINGATARDNGWTRLPCHQNLYMGFLDYMTYLKRKHGFTGFSFSKFALSFVHFVGQYLNWFHNNCYFLMIKNHRQGLFCLKFASSRQDTFSAWLS